MHVNVLLMGIEGNGKMMFRVWLAWNSVTRSLGHMKTEINKTGSEWTQNRAVGTSHMSNTMHMSDKLRGLSPRANYTDRATAVCRRT
jgi:hypothetical protein